MDECILRLSYHTSVTTHIHTPHNHICTSVCTMNSRLARMFLTHSYTLTVFALGICCNIISSAMYVPVRPTPALNTSETHSNSHYTLVNRCLVYLQWTSMGGLCWFCTWACLTFLIRAMTDVANCGTP